MTAEQTATLDRAMDDAGVRHFGALGSLLGRTLASAEGVSENCRR